jgi:hypothetical protein
MTKLKPAIIGLIGIISFLYLVNPGFGIFEFIPDMVPFIGNLDEGAASFFLLSVLAYFGIDLRNVFGTQLKKKN